MRGVAWASLRRRRGAFVAALLSVFFGTAIVMTFAAMLDTALQTGTASVDRTTLLIIASVVGGWGAVIVASAVATTVAVTTRGRTRELALLRSAGASPVQVVRLIMTEMVAVIVTGVLAATPVGWVAGRWLLAGLRATDQVGEATSYRFGVCALGAGLIIGAGVALGACWLVARRAAARPVVQAFADAAGGGRRIGRVRVWAGLICVGIAAQNVVLSLTMVDGADVYDVQMIASEACIFAGIGFALLAPLILDRAITVATPVMTRLAGMSGELALAGMRARLVAAATPVMPIIVVTSIAVGTLYMQVVTNSLHAVADDPAVALLNYVVVGMIVIFAAVMLVNLLVVTINDRRVEFAQQRLIGASPRQLRHALWAETGLLLVVGLAFGTVGGLLTVIPFTAKTTGRLLPDASVGIYAGIIGGVVVLTAAATALAARCVTGADALAVMRQVGQA